MAKTSKKKPVKKSEPTDSVRLLLDIPQKELEILEQLAADDGRLRKNYLERVLIDHARKHIPIEMTQPLQDVKKAFEKKT